MSLYLRNGTAFKVASKESLDLHEILPAANYVIKCDPSGNLYLDAIDPFEISGKMYGSTENHSKRVLNTFKERVNATGVMFTGEKGSGKSLLARHICFSASKDQIPTIIINAPHCGEKFNAFIQSIDQPAIVLFDEFEKVYDEVQQMQMLTLLDGVYPSKKLFIFTCNDKWRVDSHMRNRPGRIFYMIDFKGLEPSFVSEYCEDNLNDKQYIGRVCNVATMFRSFNFDMLKALVEEMNRYSESPETSLKMLNIKPEYETFSVAFNVELAVDGVKIPIDKLHNETWHGNPLTERFNLAYDKPVKSVVTDNGNEADADDTYCIAQFDSGDIVKIDTVAGKYTYRNRKGEVATLTTPKKDERSLFDRFEGAY